MTQRGSCEEGRMSKKQHFWADIQRNLEKYKLYAQYGGLQCQNPECKRNDSFAFHSYYRGRKRYKCKCGATVNDFSQTLFHRCRHPEQWTDFMDLVVKGASLGQMSKQLGLSKVTLYRWRKKFVQLATDYYQEKLQGLIVAEEVEITSLERPKYVRNSEELVKGNKQIYLIVAKDRLDNFVFQINQNRSNLWDAFLSQVNDKSTIHSNVPLPPLPNNTVLKDVKFFGPSEGHKTVEKRDRNSPVSQFLRHFTNISLIYRGLPINDLIGFLSLFALQHKLKKITREQQGTLFRYTMLTNNMGAANKLLFN
ncbi:hypothetical protein NDK47_23710 [Brevibacillus ruminantium]|uniref:Transposase n=1 Tax=Brevibacillus ruminantium TaxID=2950604 RepID=A0ABY4WG40_9BACL|nr:hypothetical protein [Brevibacillus ruminantium]USG65093.1 hypothetical protein NDK47_23710 [Brevibacillus ruminantium]